MGERYIEEEHVFGSSPFWEKIREQARQEVAAALRSLTITALYATCMLLASLWIILTGCTQQSNETTVQHPHQAMNIEATMPMTRTVVNLLDSPTILPDPNRESTPTIIPDPLDDFKQAMRFIAREDVAEQHRRPIYRLHVVLTEEKTLQGTEHIALTNTTGKPLQDVVVRLYPNDPQQAPLMGRHPQMQVSDISVNGILVNPTDHAQASAVHIPLPRPLAPEAKMTLAMTFTAHIEPWEDNVFVLPAYYPMLAFHDGTAWHSTPSQFFGDIHAETAFYDVEMTVPSAYHVIATGSSPSTYIHKNNTKTYKIYSGPVRVFALAIGDFEDKRSRAGVDSGVDVALYKPRGNTLDMTPMMRVVTAALTDHERTFGTYPYHELDVLILPGQPIQGISYPGLIVLPNAGKGDDRLRFMAASGVARQWWGNIVGNDVQGTAWINAALTQYSGILYDRHIEGTSVVNHDWAQEIEQRYQNAPKDLLLGMPLSSYPSLDVYQHVVFGKGAMFLHTLQEQIGDKPFYQALQNYYQRHRYERATSYDIQQTFEEASGKALQEIFDQWVVSHTFPITITLPPTLSPSFPSAPQATPLQTPTGTLTIPTTTTLTLPLPTATILSNDLPTSTQLEQTIVAAPLAKSKEERNLSQYATAKASSVLPPEQTQQYGIVQYETNNLFDGDRSTCWIEGVPGSGIGEYLIISLTQPMTISRIGMDVGFDRDDAIFYANNRVQRVQLVFAESDTQQIEFEDRRGIQYRNIQPVRTDLLGIVIDEIYAGKAYQDTAIAEIELWGDK